MDKKQKAIFKRIIDYLRKNPEAGDTLEGICRWWIKSECIERSVDEVAVALDVLVKKGLIIRQEVKGSSPIFSIRKLNHFQGGGVYEKKISSKERTGC